MVSQTQIAQTTAGAHPAPASVIGAIIIGDEIVRGKRQDKHFATLVEMLKKRGLVLDWVQYLGDHRVRLTDTLKRTLATDDIVFSFGGIGATPDDHTRQAAAEAVGEPLELHPDAEREIRARFAEIGQEVTPTRLELGTYARGSRIIPNPYNRIPGFSIGNHHFLPGFPQMSWPMAEWVLDTYYAHLFNQRDEVEAAILVWEGMEGALIPLMRKLEAELPGVVIFSLPSLGDAQTQRHIELGARGTAAQVSSAMAEIRAEMPVLGYRFSEKA